jgi:transposase
MKLNNDNIKETIVNAKLLLAKEKNISPALRSVFQLLLVFMEVMLERLSLNSKNSSKPPSSDPNRKKSTKRNKTKKKPGGQPGRIGKQLKPVSDPDKIELLKLDKRTLPRDNYRESGFEARQVVDFEVSICVTEYRAQVLIGSDGKRYVAPFPAHVKRPIQYGPKAKASAVYMSQFQLTPYARIVDYFSEQVGLNVSQGSLFNFNKEAYEILESFEEIAKSKLIESTRVNADETGVNINGKRLWLHTACNDKWTHFYPHAKRGSEAMDTMGILPNFMGVLCHDHWKPYYQYACKHALCNAHHLRELEWAATEDNQVWASEMKDFLTQLNQQVDEAGGKLNAKQQIECRKAYKGLLVKAQIECPPPDTPVKKKKPGRPKKSKSRNLLERFINFEDDVLRFTQDVDIPFTNNQGENDLRMTKVQQKISGCFRSEEGARIFCRVRAYLITCRKHGVGVTEALETLFKGKLPDFVGSQIDFGE